MAEFEEKLNAILGNQEAMGQIMALARSLSGGQEAASSGAQAGNAQAGSAREPEGEGAAPPQAPDLSALLGEADPAMLQMGMRVVRELQGDDDRNAALLRALRPFLREERRARLDRALQIARMTRLIRAALGAVGGREEEGRV